MKTLIRILEKIVVFIGSSVIIGAFWLVSLVIALIAFSPIGLFWLFIVPYFLYRAVRGIYRFNRSYQSIFDRQPPAKKKAGEYTLSYDLQDVQELPTTEHLQQLIAEDGEIPDEALASTRR